MVTGRVFRGGAVLDWCGVRVGWAGTRGQRGYGRRQEGVEECEADLFGAADPGGKAVEQDFGLLPWAGGAELGEADSLGGEIAG